MEDETRNMMLVEHNILTKQVANFITFITGEFLLLR